MKITDATCPAVCGDNKCDLPNDHAGWHEHALSVATRILWTSPADAHVRKRMAVRAIAVEKGRLPS